MPADRRCQPTSPARFEELVAEGRRADAFGLFMTIAAELPAEMAIGIQEDPMWPALESVTHTIAYDGQIMGETQSGDPAAIARFASIAVPALVMDGCESPDHQRNAVQMLAEILPNAQRRTVQGQSHQFAATALAPIVAEFFAGETSVPLLRPHEAPYT
jgi:hypothetical protein